MKYYYDFLINLEDELYEFYEWSSKDFIIYVKSMPLFRVSSKVMELVINNHIILSHDILAKIKGKTLVKGEEDNLSYAVLLTDTFNSVVILVNDDGREIALSKLMVEDDLNLMEIGFTIEEENIGIEVLCPRKKRLLRQDSEVARYLMIEYQFLYKNKFYDKLRYWYYETFKKEEKNINLVYKRLLDDLKVIAIKHYKLAEEVKSTYKKELFSSSN